MAEYKGIDVSKWQGDIDWAKVKAYGVQFAMLRCGTGANGGSKDKFFEQNYKQARENRISLGAYYYTYAKNVDQAKKDADNVIEWIKGKEFEYPIVFDIEDNTQASLGKTKTSAIIKAFCEKIEKAGYYVMVYANKDWLENRIDEEVKTKYDIWLAQWSSKPTYKGNYGIWQYTSKGKVNGISGNVDMDYAFKNYPLIMKSSGLNGYTKKTEQTTNPQVSQTQSKYFKKYTGKTVSIVDALKSIGVNSAFSYRKQIAKANGIKSYLGTASQNTKLLDLLKAGKLLKP